MNYNFQEDPFHLSPLWAATLDVYQEFAKLCDKYGLRYYITDGNCIGAVRHKGFIPWDDDFDVSMPRPDYDRLLEVVSELPSHLKFVNWRNTPEFKLLFGKIQDCRPNVVSEVERQVGHSLSNGIFIDVFPIEGYTKCRLMDVWLKQLYRATGFIEHFRQEKFWKLSAKLKVKWLIGAVLSVWLPRVKTHRQFMELYEKRIKKYAFGSGPVTGRASLCGAVTLKYPLAAWGSPSKGDYNGLQVPLPADCDAYLKVEYPDYMTLPPVEKRHPTHTYAERCPWWLGPTRDGK